MSSSPLSEPDVDATETANKRRSGRVTRKPDLFTAAGGAKRKRDAVDDREAHEDGEDEVEDEDESDSEGEPDEEEMRETKSKARKGKAAPAKKPAAKRSKTHGTATLSVRADQAKTRKPKKAKALDEAAAEEAGGLFGTTICVSPMRNMLTCT